MIQQEDLSSLDDIREWYREACVSEELDAHEIYEIFFNKEFYEEYYAI